MCDLKSCGSQSTDKPLPRATDEQRRAFVKGTLALPLAVVLADPLLAQAASDRMKSMTIDLQGGGKVSGYLAKPQGVHDKMPTVLLIHEWWGLNDQIKAVANDLAQQGFIAFAVDLYQGKVATTREEANAYRKAMDPEWATRALVGCVDWLKKDPDGNGKVGTIGWCFGGGWSLNTALVAPVDAAVIYYGNVQKTAAELQSLHCPVLGHFGTLDKNINEAMVGAFQREMRKAGKTDLTVHWYIADHAFANPTGARYDEEDAALAWSRTLTFLYQYLRDS